MNHFSFSYISLEDIKPILYTFLGITYITLLVIAYIRFRNKNNSDFKIQSIEAEIIIYTTQFLLLSDNVHEKEIEFAFSYFKKGNSLIYANDIKRQLLFNIKNKIDTSRASKLNQHNSSHKDRLHLIYFLFELASVTKPITDNELNFIENLSRKLRISTAIFRKVKNKFIPIDNTDNLINFAYSENAFEHACNILGVPVNSTYKEIKKAYRKSVQKYHPDKVTKYGDSAIEEAEKEFLKIKSAYELLKKKLSK